MTHIMLPDGVLPWWVSVGGLLVAIAVVGACSVGLRPQATPRAIATAAVMGAFMVVVMSIDLPPIGYEMHGTVLAGIVVGPRLASVVAPAFNVARWLLGDGAFTNLGLNSTLTWLEMAGGYGAFRVLRRVMPPRFVALTGGLATVGALALATVVSVTILLVSGEDSYRATFASTFGEASLAAQSDGGGPLITGATFAAAILIMAAFGWLLEGIATGVILAFIARARPGIVHGMAPRSAPLH